jgi:hypothetical protein
MKGNWPKSFDSYREKLWQAGLTADRGYTNPQIRRPQQISYVSEMADKPSKLKIADREFSSRLLVGTGKFAGT